MPELFELFATQKRNTEPVSGIAQWKTVITAFRNDEHADDNTDDRINAIKQ
jgi:hypothetical protein